MSVYNINDLERDIDAMRHIAPHEYERIWQNNLLRRALAAYYRRPCVHMHCNIATRVFFDGYVYYVRIASWEGITAVYRFNRGNNALIRVTRWPSNLDLTPECIKASQKAFIHCISARRAA